MNSTKTHIYFVPGLAASSKIFEYLSLSNEKFEFHFLEWLLPLSVSESIENYAKRMADQVIHENSVLLGVSFGGIMVQEMSKYLNANKIILISSVKCRDELPKRLKVIQKTKAYKLFLSKSIKNIEDFSIYAFGDMAIKRVHIYKEYLSIRDEKYLNWAIYNVLHWQQKDPLPNILHLHGIDDSVFPIKHIKNSIPIKNGTHIMILNKAKYISKIINDSF
jgi:pimeloyl-ACP methyl ester carboxylesterase